MKNNKTFTKINLAISILLTLACLVGTIYSIYSSLYVMGLILTLLGVGCGVFVREGIVQLHE